MNESSSEIKRVHGLDKGRSLAGSHNGIAYVVAYQLPNYGENGRNLPFLFGPCSNLQGTNLEQRQIRLLSPEWRERHVLKRSSTLHTKPEYFSKNWVLISMKDDKKVDWKPLPNESADDYVERIGGHDGVGIHAVKNLQRDFGMSHAEAKECFQNSRSRNKAHLTPIAEKLHRAGHRRETVINNLRRRSSLSETEIQAIVDSVGTWKIQIRVTSFRCGDRNPN